MKKILTLTAASLLAAGTFSAQAQVTVDGQLTAAELTAGNYVLLGKFTNARGFGDAGLLSLYASSTASKLFFFVGGTVEANGNAFQLYMDLPGITGAAAGTPLPVGTAGTSFEKMTARMELSPDLALALRSDGTGFQIEGAYYTGTTASSRKITTTAGVVPGTGVAQALPTTGTTGAGYSLLAGARVAYFNSPMGRISTNPGNTAVVTNPLYGGVGSFGWEIEIDRTTAGLATGTPSLTVFLLQNNGGGGFLSSDYIPQNSAPVTAVGYPVPNLGGPDNNNGLGNSGGPVDFAVVPGRQATTITLGATGVLGTRTAAAAALALGVYPNPANGVATVAYNVGSYANQVNIVLTDLLGRPVQVLENSLQAAGAQTKTLNTANIAAGTYLVRVQVGETVATSKLVVL